MRCTIYFTKLAGVWRPWLIICLGVEAIGFYRKYKTQIIKYIVQMSQYE